MSFLMSLKKSVAALWVATLLATLTTNPLLAQAKEASTSPGLFDFLILPIGFMFIMFMIMRPHHKKIREQASFLQEIKVGDEVVTTGGIIGRVRSIADQFVSLEVASGTHMKIAKPFLKGLAKAELATDPKKS